MKISKTRLLENICSKDSNRPAMMNPYFDGNTITCTDGRVLISFVPDEISPEDTPGIIPLEILKLSRQGDEQISLSDKTAKTTNKKGITSETVRDGFVFPDWIKLFPSDKNCIRVGIDAKLLYYLARAAGKPNNYTTAGQVILNIPRDQEKILTAIEVNFPGQEDKALIMPCRVE